MPTIYTMPEAPGNGWIPPVLPAIVICQDDSGPLMLAFDEAGDLRQARPVSLEFVRQRIAAALAAQRARLPVGAM